MQLTPCLYSKTKTVSSLKKSIHILRIRQREQLLGNIFIINETRKNLKRNVERTVRCSRTSKSNTGYEVE